MSAVRRSNGHGCRARIPSLQAGVTLTELLISMALSLLVVTAATALFVSAKSAYVAQDDLTDMQDAARYAMDVIARAVRQAGYEDWSATQAASATALPGAPLMGLDARSLKATTAGIDWPVAKSVNGSDVLAVRFSGAGAGETGDGTILNCAGFGIPAAVSSEESRGWSIFYVAKDASGEPELYCKYRGRDSWSAQSIASGVEAFQVLYAIDTDADGMANRLLSASAIDALDDVLPLQGDNAAERAADKSRKSHWNKVVAVRIALLVRGAHAVRNDDRPTAYDLFGSQYTSAHAATDPGVRIREADLPNAVRARERRIFSATIRLRNNDAERM